MTNKILIDEATVRQALVALEKGKYYAKTLMMSQEPFDAVIKALADQPAQQEPVPWSQALEGVWAEPDDTTPQPAQRTWVGLTDEDLANCSGHEVRWALYWEKLLKEKNT